MPGQGAPEGKEGQRLQPRSLADRSARAAALQPISASRAELLGVQVRKQQVILASRGVMSCCQAGCSVNTTNHSYQVATSA